MVRFLYPLFPQKSDPEPEPSEVKGILQIPREIFEYDSKFMVCNRSHRTINKYELSFD